VTKPGSSALSVVEIQTSLSGEGYPIGRRTTALKTLKIAVFIPMATASVRTTASEKAGLPRRLRSA
jgi:hypothetical protein